MSKVDSGHLWQACRDGDLETIKRLLSKGVDLKGLFGYACEQGALPVVRLLIDLKVCSPQEIDEGLSVAMSSVQSHLVLYFVDEIFDVHKDNDNPIRYAAQEGDYGLLVSLIERGADIHCQDDACFKVSVALEHDNITDYLFKLDESYFSRLIQSDEALSCNSQLMAKAKNYELGLLQSSPNRKRLKAHL